MAHPVLHSFPSRYADALKHIRLRPFGVLPSAVRKLELTVNGRGEAFPALVNVSDEMSVVPAVSLVEGDMWLTDSVITSWGITTEQLLGDVFEGIGELEIEVRAVGDATYVVHSTVFAGAVWLQPQMVSGLKVTGTSLIWNAGDGVTIVTGDEDPQGFQIAAAVLGERLQEGIEVETLVPHRLQADEWVPSVWPDSATDGLRFTERMFALQWYERQREPLTQLHEQQGMDINVPQYRVMNTPEGEVVSVCACVEGMQNAIPRVDAVLLVRNDGTAQTYPFDEFNNTKGVSIKDADVMPQRWLVTV